VRHLLYLGLLAGCLLGTSPLEFVLRVGVYRRWRRLLLAIMPAIVVGVVWDAYAVHAGQWSFDHRYLVGVWVGNLPLEELLFFLVIPACAVLTLEAVRRRVPGWTIGDEPAPEPAPGLDPGAGP
jgi:lycopene cyclase domain-containing protein